MKMLLFFHLIIVMRSQNIWNTTKTSIPFGCCALSFTVCVSLFILFFFFADFIFFECVFVPFLTVRFISVLVFVHIPFVRLTSSFKHSYSIFFIAFFVIHCWVFSLGCTVTKQLARVFFFRFLHAHWEIFIFGSSRSCTIFQSHQFAFWFKSIRLSYANCIATDTVRIE